MVINCIYPHPLLDATEYLTKNSARNSEWVMIELASSQDSYEERCAYVRKWANITHAAKEGGK